MGLEKVRSFSDVSLAGRGLTFLPEPPEDPTAINRLDLSGNHLTVLPEWLGNLTALTTLDLSGNRLAALPESLGNLTALTTLRLGKATRGARVRFSVLELGDGKNNQLTVLPESLGNLTALTTLDLSGNQLTTLPESLGNLTALTTLDLRDNQLTTLPESLGNLTALTTLDLSGNQLTTLPESLGNLTALTTLRLGKATRGARVRLWVLELGSGNGKNNQLTVLPESLGNLTALTTLDLSGNQLTTLPGSLANLTALTTLDLRDNQLTTLPESLGNLTALTTLDLSGNQLTTLPGSLRNLTALTALRLGIGRGKGGANSGAGVPFWLFDIGGKNQFTAIPEWLGDLTALTTLDLSGNQLTTLPGSVGGLTALTTLDLRGNQLTALPGSLGNLTALTTLDLSGNPLRSPLLEIAQDGTTALKAYLALVSDNVAERWTSKLLFVGEGAVGKTSLVKALSGQRHDPHEPTTHGIRIKDIEFNHPIRPDIQMRLSSWDFGGQDIYHATHQFFLTDRSLFVLLWNARQGWEYAKIQYWLDIIKARAPQARVILVATHAEGRPVDLPLTELKASYPQIVESVSVDNRTREGIGDLRRKMAKHAADLPLMGSRWPTAWATGAESIHKYRQKYATPDALYRQLSKVGVTERSHQIYLLRALHLLGEILYFEDDEELRDTIILRPQWVSDYIDKVLDSREVAEREGLLTREHQRQLWRDLDVGLGDLFLRMMERFDLSYRITDDATAASLVVERLPWEIPPYQERWDAARDVHGAHEIRLRYQLSTLPPGIPTWFIAREHRFSTGNHWRSGALLCQTSDPRVLGLIRVERQDRTVDLVVRGPVPQSFFSVLQDGFELTLSRYQGLKINRMVPCICDHGDGTQPGHSCTYIHEYGSLIRRLEQSKSQPAALEVECGRSFLKVSVAELLFGLTPTTLDQIVSQTATIGRELRDLRSETALAHRQFFKAFREAQARAEAVCPSVFTVIPAKSRKPGFHRLELRLYCEQPGAFHATPEPPYIIDEPARWLAKIGPYLTVLLIMLKHAVPLAGPVLGLTSDQLAKQLDGDLSLMTEVVSQLPEAVGVDQFRAEELRQSQLDVDYRALQALLDQLDPSKYWAGLSRTPTPESDVLWLCRDHAQQYSV